MPIPKGGFKPRARNVAGTWVPLTHRPLIESPPSPDDRQITNTAHADTSDALVPLNASLRKPSTAGTSSSNASLLHPSSALTNSSNPSRGDADTLWVPRSRPSSVSSTSSLRPDIDMGDSTELTVNGRSRSVTPDFPEPKLQVGKKSSRALVPLSPSHFNGKGGKTKNLGGSVKKRVLQRRETAGDKDMVLGVKGKVGISKGSKKRDT